MKHYQPPWISWLLSSQTRVEGVQTQYVTWRMAGEKASEELVSLECIAWAPPDRVSERDVFLKSPMWTSSQGSKAGRKNIPGSEKAPEAYSEARVSRFIALCFCRKMKPRPGPASWASDSVAGALCAS